MFIVVTLFQFNELARFALISGINISYY